MPDAYRKQIYPIMSLLIITWFPLLQTSVTDVLHAMGAVPSGFRLSTLGQKFNTGIFIVKVLKLQHLSLSFSQKNVGFGDWNIKCLSE